VEHSFLFNLVYHRIQRTRSGRVPYMDYLAESYSDPCCWKVHTRVLNMIIDLCRQNGTRCIAVVYPHLHDIAGSMPMVNKVLNVFRTNDVQTINVAELVRDVPTDKLVVSSFNAHPSVWLNKVLASVLHDALTGQVDIHDPKHLAVQ
jgi:hypothetical protein